MATLVGVNTNAGAFERDKQKALAAMVALAIQGMQSKLHTISDDWVGLKLDTSSKLQPGAEDKFLDLVRAYMGRDAGGPPDPGA